MKILLFVLFIVSFLFATDLKLNPKTTSDYKNINQTVITTPNKKFLQESAKVKNYKFGDTKYALPHSLFGKYYPIRNGRYLIQMNILKDNSFLSDKQFVYRIYDVKKQTSIEKDVYIIPAQKVNSDFIESRFSLQFIPYDFRNCFYVTDSTMRIPKQKKGPVKYSINVHMPEIIWVNLRNPNQPKAKVLYNLLQIDYEVSVNEPFNSQRFFDPKTKKEFDKISEYLGPGNIINSETAATIYKGTNNKIYFALYLKTERNSRLYLLPFDKSSIVRKYNLPSIRYVKQLLHDKKKNLLFIIGFEEVVAWDLTKSKILFTIPIDEHSTFSTINHAATSLYTFFGGNCIDVINFSIDDPYVERKCLNPSDKYELHEFITTDPRTDAFYQIAKKETDQDTKYFLQKIRVGKNDLLEIEKEKLIARYPRSDRRRHILKLIAVIPKQREIIITKTIPRTLRTETLAIAY